MQNSGKRVKINFALSLFSCLCLSGCLAVPLSSSGNRQTEGVTSSLDGLAHFRLQVPVPNNSIMQQAVKNASPSEMEALSPGKHLYLMSRTWGNSSPYVMTQEIELDVSIGRISRDDSSEPLTIDELKEYFKGRLDSGALVSLLKIGNLEWVNYSTNYANYEKDRGGVFQLASEVFSIPVGSDFYLFIAYRFHDHRKQYELEWVNAKREEVRELMNATVVDLQ